MSEGQTSRSEIFNCPETRLIQARFVANLPEYIGNIKESFESENLSTLSASAHKLKGTAACFGYEHLSHIAKDIEELAATDNREQISSLVSQLETLSREAKNELEP